MSLFGKVFGKPSGMCATESHHCTASTSHTDMCCCWGIVLLLLLGVDERLGWSAHAAGDAEEDETEVERLLQQIADARHAGDRRDAMSQLSSLLQDNLRVSLAPAAPCV